jgi:hypothetical protein
MILNLRRTAVVSAFCLLTSGPAAATAAGTAAPPHRVLGQSTLAYFRVTLVATRGLSLGGAARATVTAAGYQRSGTSWRLISRKTVGQPDQWFWNTVEICSLAATQLVNLPQGPATLETATVSLLTTLGPGGCSTGYEEDWVVP